MTTLSHSAVNLLSILQLYAGITLSACLVILVKESMKPFIMNRTEWWMNEKELTVIPCCTFHTICRDNKASITFNASFFSRTREIHTLRALSYWTSWKWKIITMWLKLPTSCWFFLLLNLLPVPVAIICSVEMYMIYFITVRFYKTLRITAVLVQDSIKLLLLPLLHTIDHSLQLSSSCRSYCLCHSASASSSYSPAG